MELDARELQDLAGFFGRRFPERSAADMAAAAGVRLAPSAGWTSLVAEAARADRLPQLAAAARAARPGDPRMEELGRILGPSRRIPRAAMALAALGLVALAGFAVAPSGAGPGVAAPAEAHAAAASVAEAPAPEVAPAAASEAAPAPEAAPEAPASAPSSAGLVSAPSTSSGLCRGAAGSVVGYYYAGSAAPGALGETVTLTGGARVRADYPDRHNRFNASAEVRCVLPPGSRLRLDAAPVAVPGAAYWVPVVAGSVL